MALEDVYVERYVEEVLTPQRATLRIRVRFSEGQLLENGGLFMNPKFDLMSREELKAYLLSH